MELVLREQMLRNTILVFTGILLVRLIENSAHEAF